MLKASRSIARDYTLVFHPARIVHDARARAEFLACGRVAAHYPAGADQAHPEPGRNARASLVHPPARWPGADRIRTHPAALRCNTRPSGTRVARQPRRRRRRRPDARRFLSHRFVFFGAALRDHAGTGRAAARIRGWPVRRSKPKSTNCTIGSPTARSILSCRWPNASAWAWTMCRSASSAMC